MGGRQRQVKLHFGRAFNSVTLDYMCRTRLGLGCCLLEYAAVHKSRADRCCYDAPAALQSPLQLRCEQHVAQF